MSRYVLCCQMGTSERLPKLENILALTTYSLLEIFNICSSIEFMHLSPIEPKVEVIKKDM